MAYGLPVDAATTALRNDVHPARPSLWEEGRLHRVPRRLSPLPRAQPPERAFVLHMING